MLTRSKRKLVGVAGVVTLVAGGVVAGVGSASANPDTTADSLEWSKCEGQDLAGLECATLNVPLDYERPSGPTIEVAVSRLASTNPDERRGVLLLNPGGPGGSGLNMPLLMKQLGLPSTVLDQYDLIGFDPRGVGQSTPVTCDWNTQEQTAHYPSQANSPQDVVERKAVVDALSKKCAESETADVLPYMNTANTARDMDQIRTALGEDRISYYGISYGSYLGSVYTQLFPEQSDRIVLDSVVGPDMVWHDEFRLAGFGGELRFPDFARWAALRNDKYGLGSTPKQVRKTYLRLAAKTDEKPVQGVTGTLYRWTVFGFLYGDATFPDLAKFMRAIDRTDGAAAADLVAESKPESWNTSAPQVPADNFHASQAAVLCNDAEWPTSVEQYQRDVAKDGKRYPLFGATMSNMWDCAGWQVDRVEPPVDIDDSVSSKALILQNVRDPITTIPGAFQLRGAMGDDRARMVTVDDGGHGVYLFNDNACATDITSQYLASGEFPASDQFCAAETDGKLPFRSTPEREEALEQLQAKQRLF